MWNECDPIFTFLHSRSITEMENVSGERSRSQFYNFYNFPALCSIVDPSDGVTLPVKFCLSNRASFNLLARIALGFPSILVNRSLLFKIKRAISIMTYYKLAHSVMVKI